MKSFVTASGCMLLLLPLFIGVTEGKFDVHTFVPDALRKAKQGLDVVLRKSPPPAPVIPHRTGNAAIDQALFQTLQWGNSLKHSLSQQCAVMFSTPTLSRVICTATPTAMLLLVAHSLFQFFQSNLRPLFSSSERVNKPMEVAKSVAWTAAVGVWMYQLQVLFRSHPALVLGEAVLFTAASILWNKSRASHQLMSPIPLDEMETGMEMMDELPVDSIITMDVIVPENEAVAPTLDEDSVTVESSPESSVEVEERPMQVNVTKISAVLDRFESKILSLVGGTRFAAASKHSDEEESATVADVEEDTPQVDIEMTQFAEDDLVEVLYDEEDETEDISLGEQEVTAEAEPEVTPLEQPQLVTSLTPYQIMTPSKSFLRFNMATKSIMTTVSLIGLVSGQVSVFQSIPPMVRHSLVTVAALCLVGLLVHELYQIWMTQSKTTGTFDSLLQQVESSATTFSEKLDPLIVELARRPHMRFFRTRIPILDGVAGISQRIASPTSPLEDAEVETEVEEDLPTEVVSSPSHCSHSKDDETSRTFHANIVAPIFRRWVAPPSTPKVACTSIVGL